MPSQQISIKKEVKDKLEALKLGEESFTEVIQRLLENLRLSNYAGLLSDLPETHKSRIRYILSWSGGSETS
jgi:predicted CopG family antitoxin